MPLKLKKTVKELCAEAEKEIQTVTPQEAIKLKDDPGVLLVDIRDIRELQRDGHVPGAFHAPRGMLEFWVDPESPYYKDVFGSGKRFVFFCAGGLRSALATQVVQRMGIEPVCHIRGGFRAWKESGGPVEPLPEKKSPEKNS
jgi:rhodanese-related sulfurtransferase